MESPKKCTISVPVLSKKEKKEIEKTDFIFYNSIFSQNIILFIGKEYLGKKRKYETKEELVHTAGNEGTSLYFDVATVISSVYIPF